MSQTLSIQQRIRLLVEWSPAIPLVTAITAAAPGRERVQAVITLLEFLAGKSDTAIDNEVLGLVRKMLLTPEGGALVDYVSGLVTVFAEAAEHEQYRRSGS